MGRTKISCGQIRVHQQEVKCKLSRSEVVSFLAGFCISMICLYKSVKKFYSQFTPPRICIYLHINRLHSLARRVLLFGTNMNKNLTTLL